MPKPPGMSGKRSFGGKCAFAVLLVAVLSASGMFATKGVTAAGLTGSHGTFTVQDCYPHHSSSSRSSSRSYDFDCDGTFRSDDGKATDGQASMNSVDTDYRAGIRLPVQAHDGSTLLSFLASTYTIASRGEVTKNFVIAFSVLLALPFLLFGWLTGFGETGGTIRQMRETWRATAGTRTRTIVLTSAAAALFGMIVISPVLGFLLPTAG
ncbi:hypothetical protein [Streptomyces decoyicus]|uniref:hypothetical protein n=2 Tax=Streptomyces decoyicus TaxID=249567 RepID=UPI00386AC21C|nr:hypothetical protein OG532_12090 [Streptomyces decoyicus]